MKTTLLIMGLLLMGCETGVTDHHNETTSSRSEAGTTAKTVVHTKSGEKIKLKRIFSTSAQPGYYLQVGYFKSHPSSAFESKLQYFDNYTILNKNGYFYALVGPYKSYNMAQSRSQKVHSILKKNGFVVEVLRP